MPATADAPEGSERTEIAWILAGRVWIRGRLEPAEIAIDGRGRIQSLGKIRRGAPRHDVGDAVILPAATDLHVHLREPGGTDEVESIPGGTKAAALGGVTLVGDMPNTAPPITDPERLEEKARLVRGRAAIDLLLYAGVSPNRPLERLAAVAGGFKVYLSPTTGIGEVPEASEIPELLRRLAELDLPVSVHAEDPTSFGDAQSAQNPIDWNRARPSEAEGRAIDRLLPPPPRLRLHVAHVTTIESVGKLRTAGVSFEAAPHHLLLSERSGSDARFKVNPPLRSEAERQALWAAFVRGEVPCLASDHAPHSLASKNLPFERAPSGMPGVETMFPLLLSRVRARELGLGTLIATACERPARWLGQPLGRIAPGHRANLLVVDFRRHRPLSARNLATACGWTAFEGMDAIFPREHYRDGRRIVEDGEFIGMADGEVVRPEYALRPKGEGRGTAVSAPSDSR